MAALVRGLSVALLSGLAAALPAACGEGDDAGPPAQETGPSTQRQEAAEPTAPRREASRYRAVVAIEDEDRIAVLRGPPWRVVRTVRAASGPHNVAADPGGRHVAVSSPPAGEVTVLNSRGQVSARVSAGAGAHDVAFTPDGDRLWVTAEDEARIVEVEVPSGRVVGSRRTSGPPHDVAVSPDGEELWVTIDGSSAVEVRSARSGELRARPDLGVAPHDVAIDPDGKRAWFSNWSSPLLTVASAKRRETLDRIEAGAEPHHFDFGPRWLWVTDNGGGEVLRIDPGSRRIRGGTRVGTAPHHVAVAGRQALVAVHGSGQLAVVSREGDLQRRIEVGAGPHGVAALER